MFSDLPRITQVALVADLRPVTFPEHHKETPASLVNPCVCDS